MTATYTVDQYGDPDNALTEAMVTVEATSWTEARAKAKAIVTADGYRIRGERTNMRNQPPAGVVSTWRCVFAVRKVAAA